MPRLNPAGRLGLIIGFSLLVHLPGITSPLLDYHAYRQCQTASMARNYARHGMHFLNPELDTNGAPQRAGTEFPIYSYLLAVLFKVFGVREIFGRLLSMVFAAWGAAYLYLFVRSRLGESIGLTSGMVMSVIPIHIYFTRTVQPEPMALWGLLGFLYHMDKWLNRNGGAVDWVLAILLGALAPLLKLPMLYLIGPLWLYLGWECYGWRAIGCPRWLSTLIGILALTGLWYHYAKSAPVGVLPLSAEEHWQNLRPIFTWGLWRNHFISRLPELCLTYPGMIFAAVGTYHLYKKGEFRLWGFWFGVTALYIVLLGDYGLIHRYTELPWAPINAVLIATGIVTLWGSLTRPSATLSLTGEGTSSPSPVRERAGVRRRKIFIALLVFGIPLHAALRIRHWYFLEYPWVFRARDVIAGVSRPGEWVITNTREHPVLLYYIDRYGFAPALEETGLEVLDSYRAQGARFFLTPTDESWARHPEWKDYFAKNAKLVISDPKFLVYAF